MTRFGGSLPVLVLYLSALASGQQFRVLHSFTGKPDGEGNQGRLVVDAAGNLYGATSRGGQHNRGTVFQVQQDGTETVLHSFENQDGRVPLAGLTSDAKGNLFGTTYAGGSATWGALFELSHGPHDWTETVVHSFGVSGHPDGTRPEGTVLSNPAGNLYGTTADSSDNRGRGTVFMLTPSGDESLYIFPGNGSGNHPYGELRSLGNAVYGTAHGGKCCGVIFRLDNTGTETVLHSFTGGKDGALPASGLVLDKAGNLYGATSEGGDLSCFSPYGCGVIFKIDSAGNGKVLHTFTGTDGSNPSGLALDSEGNLYGVTEYGGDGNCSIPPNANGCGVVFKLDSIGNETILYSFAGKEDGAYPNVPLVSDAAGNLYGTTTADGDPTCSCGTVFEISGAQ